MRELSEEEYENVKNLKIEGLEFEARQILGKVPEGRKADYEGLFHAADYLEKTGNLDTAVEIYMLETSRIYLGNAFSLNMLDLTTSATVLVAEVDPEKIPEEAISVIGHEDTAKIFGEILKREVSHNRATLKLGLYDILYVGQYSGPRLPEGTTRLPEGASVKWIKVQLV
jgi:hypothetical protein